MLKMKHEPFVNQKKVKERKKHEPFIIPGKHTLLLYQL